MKITELLSSLPPLERERMLGRIEGMQMAIRICNNRAEDIKDSLNRSQEAAVLAGIIRICQVNIGSGISKFGDLSEDEQAAIWRIF